MRQRLGRRGGGLLFRYRGLCVSENVLVAQLRWRYDSLSRFRITKVTMLTITNKTKSITST